MERAGKTLIFYKLFIIVRLPGFCYALIFVTIKEKSGTQLVCGGGLVLHAVSFINDGFGICIGSEKELEAFAAYAGNILQNFEVVLRNSYERVTASS